MNPQPSDEPDRMKMKGCVGGMGWVRMQGLLNIEFPLLPHMTYGVLPPKLHLLPFPISSLRNNVHSTLPVPPCTSLPHPTSQPLPNPTLVFLSSLLDTHTGGVAEREA